MFVLAQVIVAIVSAFMLLGGLTLLILGPTPLLGIALALIGLAGFAVLLVERMRYRSDPTERPATAGWSPGGEPADETLDPRFRPTDELFLDPTTGTTMRVYIDDTTGERLYRAEG